MTLDEADRFFEAKGYRIKVVFKNLKSWQACIERGRDFDAEFGKTAEEAIDRLVRKHGGDPAALGRKNPWAGYEEAVSAVTQTLRRG